MGSYISKVREGINHAVDTPEEDSASWEGDVVGSNEKRHRRAKQKKTLIEEGSVTTLREDSKRMNRTEIGAQGVDAKSVAT